MIWFSFLQTCIENSDIIMIGSANPFLQLKTHFSVLGSEMGLSTSEVKSSPGPKATFSSVVWSHGPDVL